MNLIITHILEPELTTAAVAVFGELEEAARVPV